MQNVLEELPFASGKLIVVDNYLEAVGIMHAIKTGVAPDSVRRPLILDAGYGRYSKRRDR